MQIRKSLLGTKDTKVVKATYEHMRTLPYERARLHKHTKLDDIRFLINCWLAFHFHMSKHIGYFRLGAIGSFRKSGVKRLDRKNQTVYHGVPVQDLPDLQNLRPNQFKTRSNYASRGKRTGATSTT
jgi:hypothetical protein